MNSCEWQLGIFGTFDVENYGDLLFPLIAERELRRRLGPMRVRPFSYHRKSPPEWPYAVESLTELPAVVGELDLMVIGGGHLIRFDKSIAPGYAPTTSAIHHPTGYWLSPALLAHEFGIPVVWNAPGVHGPVPQWAEPLMAMAFGASRYIAVRDAPSRETVVRFTGGKPVEIVPDTAFGVSSLTEAQCPSPEFARLRDELGLAKPYLVVQPVTGLDAFVQLARENPCAFREYQILILPIGPILGDGPALAISDIAASICAHKWPDPRTMAELIGGADAVVGTSLHLAITALAHGVPVFRPAHRFDGKYAPLAQFDTVHSFDANVPIDVDWFKARIGRKGRSAAVNAAMSRLHEH